MTGTIFKFISFHKKKKNIENEHPFFFISANTIFSRTQSINNV